MVDTGPHLGQPIVLVAASGDPAGPLPTVPTLPPGSVAVAADAGLHLFEALGIVAHHVVGDLDSAGDEAVAAAEAAGAVVHRHHPDKDATDLELALRLAVEVAGASGIGAVVVVGQGGGRLDLVLADAGLLAAPWLAGLTVEARFGDATVHVVHGPGRLAISGRRGAVASLLAVGAVARGITTTGVRWPLVGADLAPGDTRGLSNEVVADPAVVEVATGTVLVILPGHRAPDVATRPTRYDPSPRTQPGAIP